MQIELVTGHGGSGRDRAAHTVHRTLTHSCQDEPIPELWASIYISLLTLSTWNFHFLFTFLSPF